MKKYTCDFGMLCAVGADKALLVEHIFHWVENNALNGRNIYEGKAWTYNTAEAYAEYFPCFATKKIARLLKELCDEGYIEKAFLNKNRWDRTTWYTITEKTLKIMNQKIEIKRHEVASDSVNFINAQDPKMGDAFLKNEKSDFSKIRNHISQKCEMFTISSINQLENTSSKQKAETDVSAKKSEISQKEKPQPKQKKSLREREPINDYEKVEKEYLACYDELFGQGKLCTSEPPKTTWTPARAVLKNLFRDLTADDICVAIRRATDDDWLVKNGFSLKMILANNVINRLLSTSHYEPPHRNVYNDPHTYDDF